MNGTVVSIHIAEKESAPMVAIPSARVHIGRGIEGDRYFKKSGTYSHKPNPGREVTLIELESVEGLQRDYGIILNAGDARRNIVTRGVALNHLVGKTFNVGEVVLRGVGLCEPCSHLAKLTQREVLPALVHRGGLRAQVVREGLLKVGDSISY
jgi:MOSC domain-containing protein YiiM